MSQPFRKKRDRQELLRHAVMQLARNTHALLFLRGNDARDVGMAQFSSGRSDVKAQFGNIADRHELVRYDIQTAQAAPHAFHQAIECLVRAVSHRPKRAEKRAYDTAFAHKRERTEAAQVFGKDDRVRRVLTRIEVGVDVEQHHGLASLQDYAADSVPGSERDALMAFAGSAGAVDPFQRRSDEFRHPD